MELEFIPQVAISRIKPCMLLVGLREESGWLRRLINDHLMSVCTIMEQDCFIPIPRMVKDASQAGKKEFRVPNEWIEQFRERFMLIIEVFQFDDLNADNDAQVIEDILFANKYAKEFKYEHIAVIPTVDKPLEARVEKYKRALKNVIFVSENHVNTNQLEAVVTDLIEFVYVDGMAKKYKKYMNAKVARFPASWEAKVCYSFKMAMAFEAGGDTGNALKEYHFAYTAIVEEGNNLVNNSGDKRGYCVRTRPFADVILLRMIQCMLMIGSRRESTAFLRGHMSWFAAGFESNDALNMWKAVLNCHYAWLIRDHLSKDPDERKMLRYFAEAARFALVVPMSNDSLKLMEHILSSCLSSCGPYGNKRLCELIKLLRIRLSPNRLIEPVEIFNKSQYSWSELSISVLEHIVQVDSSNSALWSLASLKADWSLLRRLEYNSNGSELSFPDSTHNAILHVNVRFHKVRCPLRTGLTGCIRILNTSDLEIEFGSVKIEFNATITVESSEYTGSNGFLFTVEPLGIGPLEVSQIILTTTNGFPISRFAFMKGSFNQDNDCMVVLPKALLMVNVEPLLCMPNHQANIKFGLTKSISNSLFGTIKILDLPPYGVQIQTDLMPFEHGENVESIDILFPIVLSQVTTIKLHYQIQFECEGYDCVPVTGQIVVDCSEPIEYTICGHSKLISNQQAEIPSELYKRTVDLVFSSKFANISDLTCIFGDHPKQFLSLNSENRIQVPGLVDHLQVIFKVDNQPLSTMIDLRPVFPKSIHGFINEKLDRLLIVNELDYTQNVIVDVEKGDAKVLICGPKHVHVTIPGNSVHCIPISVYPLGDVSMASKLNVKVSLV